MRKMFFLAVFLANFFIFNQPVLAQAEAEALEARVENILAEDEVKFTGSETPQLNQKLELLVTRGSIEGRKIIIETGTVPLVNGLKYEVGDRVLVAYGQDLEGGENFYITDYIRRGPLAWLFILFVVLSAVIAKKRGLLSLLGMVISFLVIFLLILPKILAGANPVDIAMLGSLIIIPVTFFLSHGYNPKTLTAISGTFFSLLITGVLADVFVTATKLTGFASEEAAFLQAAKGSVNIRGLLLAGIIIGALGVLDDITVSQSAIVFQLKSVNPRLKLKELYQRAMSVGQDHIASMVNTLILVYTGAALPLLLLFVDNPHPFWQIINYEIIADEVVRTLVASIGLISAVPITTVIAALVATKIKQEKKL